MKKLRELLHELEVVRTEIRTLIGENKTKEAEERMAEVRDLQKRIDLLREIETEETRAGVEVGHGGHDDPEAEYRTTFVKALRGKRLTSDEVDLLEQRAMTQGVPADGGYLVPQDIQTKIKELIRQRVDLSQLVNVEPVTTLSGSRVVELEQTITPLTVITEATDLGDLGNPKFKNVPYSVVARGGILPISNTLLQDSDQNILNYVSKWIAKKATVTTNGLILAKLNTLDKVPLADTDDIKNVINIDLDPNLALGAVVLTNQDGFNYLDTLKDQEDRYLLQPDITKAGQKLLFGLPVVVVSNKELPSVVDDTVTKAPCIIGNLVELITIFDRETFEIKATDVGGLAFARNTTDVRVIQRQDVQLIDDAAAVFGQITVS